MLKNTSWGSVADWYDNLLATDVNSYQQQVILPNLLRLMELSGRDSVLDIGCGQGFFARSFAKAGARVTGVDISPELIALAKQRANGRITYRAAPAEQLSFLPNGSITKIAAVLALQNMANPPAVLAECARVAASLGKLYLVLNHPCFRVPQNSSWEYDKTADIEYRRVARYLSEAVIKIKMHPGSNPDAATISFHRPLQYYFKQLFKAGFAVRRLEEWISHRRSTPGPRARATTLARHEFPLFLVIEAVRL